MILGTILLILGAWYRRWPPALLGLALLFGAAVTRDPLWIWHHLWALSILAFMLGYFLREHGVDQHVTWCIKALALVTLVLWMNAEFA